MKGSEKQITWAKELKEKVLDRLNQEIERQIEVKKIYAEDEKLGELEKDWEFWENEMFLKAAPRIKEKVAGCDSAKAFIETRDNPTNGAEYNWFKTISQTEIIFSEDPELDKVRAVLIKELRSFPLAQLKQHAATVLGYDYELYRSKLNVKTA